MAVTATTVTLESYLHFDGNARSAFEFYQKIFGGELSVMTYGESPMRDRFPELAEKVMHARLRLRDISLLGSDAPGNYEKPQGFRIAIGLADKTEAERIFSALADGGQIEMPLQETFWAAHFGMLKDRYGIDWLMNVEQ